MGPGTGDLKKKRRELVRMALSEGHRQCVYERVADLGSELRGKEPPQRTLPDMVCTSGSEDNELEGGGQ